MSPASAPAKPGVLAQAARPFPRAGLREKVTSVFAFRRDQIDLMTRMLAARGDIFRLPLLGMPLVMINHPDYVKRVLVDNHQNYDKDNFLFRAVRPVLRNGLIAAVGGEPWRIQRRLMQPSFHRPNIAAFTLNMTDETNLMLRRWHEDFLPRDVVNVATEVGHLAFRIVSRTLFSADVDSSVRNLEDDFTEANLIMSRFFQFPFPPLSFPTPGRRRLRTLVRGLDDFIDEVVRRRYDRGEDTQDLLSVLGAAVDEETGTGMTVQQLHNEVLNIMVGGYETTSTGASWMLYQVARHPEVQARLHQEIDSVLDGRVPAFGDLSRLPYSRMVVDETLRLNSPAWQTMRRAIGEDEIGGYRIAPGANIYLNTLTLHLHPAFWPEPDRFDPERFSPVSIAQRPRHAYVPFGSGPRVCIGKHFALTELQIILVMIAQAYRIRLPDGYPPVEPQPLITLRPGNGVNLHLERR